MGVFALFEDNTISELLMGSYFSDKPIEVFVINQDNLQIEASAKKGTISVYHILRDRRILIENKKQAVSYEFKDLAPSKAFGESAGLAFSLKFAEEICRKKGNPLPFSISATGVISDSTADAVVKRVNGINEKLQSTLGILKKGDKIFYPKENDAEIDSNLRERIMTSQIEAIPVSTVKEAIESLLKGIPDGSPDKKPGRKYLLILMAIMALAIIGYRVLGNNVSKKPFSFQEMEFHYYNPQHQYLNLIEEDSNSNLSLSSKDNYQFKIKPDTKCYLYIYQIDSSGKFDILFPNVKYSRETNPLKEGVSYWIPSEDTCYYLDEKTGEEKLYFLASSRSSNNLFSEKLKVLPVEKRKETIQKMVDFYKEFRFQHID
ncbi:MAG: DUF4384 domain-containing protein [bacterium]